MTMEIATLGGGCFWCLEAVFEILRGVERVEVGSSRVDLQACKLEYSIVSPK